MSRKPAYEDLVSRIRTLEEESIKGKRAEQELAHLAYIGRLIGSTLNIDDVYEQFAAETQKLIPIDSLAINLLNFRDNSLSVGYVSGLNIDGRKQGDPLVLEGTLSEAVIRTRTGRLIQAASVDEIVGQYPRLAPIFRAGLRSIICVPLIYRDEVIGVLHFRSKKPNAYSESDLLLAEKIVMQIAGAIANSQLFKELSKAEKSLRESEERYRELSIIDELTRLYNSRYFYHSLQGGIERAIRYKEPYTLLLFDLDDFKAFNDTYGHVEGDQVLRRIGQVVKKCIRQTDSGYRYGGEEFTILLPMTTCANGAIIAERIRRTFKKEIFSPGSEQSVHMTISTGIGQLKFHEDMKSFIHRVDQLMYQAKKSGKDRVCSE